MPVTPTYPGVYVEEVPSGVRTITGVATAITALIGRASRGPVDDPVRVQSFGDYERAFGGLSLDSPMSYSVQHFFQNGGTDAVIVRIYGPPAAPPAGVAPDGIAKLELTDGGVAAQGTLTLAANPAGGETITIGAKTYTLETPADPVAAEGTLTLAAVPIAGDTMTIDGKTYTFVTPAPGVAAQGTLTLAAVPANGETITIDAKTYTFQAVLANADGNIAIGPDLPTTQARLVAAINLTGVPGTDYAVAMTIHPTVTAAAFAGNDMVLTAKAIGAAGNGIATTETLADLGSSFSGATLGATTPGVDGGLADADGNIAIDPTLATMQARIVRAINLTGAAGTDYAASMTAHPTVAAAAAFAANILLLTAKNPGVAGNTIATTETFTDAGNVFDGATLGTTTSGSDGGLADADGNIAIGADVAATRARVIKAINRTGVAGTDYGASTAVHPTVAAEMVGNNIVLTARNSGVGGNAIVTTETLAGGGNAFDAATLGLTRPGADSLPSLVLTAANPGAWANNLRATIDHRTRNLDDPATFNIQISEIDPGLPADSPPLRTEKFFNLSVDPLSPLFVDKALESRSGLVRVRTTSAVLPGEVEGAQFSGGSDGRAIVDTDISAPGLEDGKRGVWALKKTDLFNILCIPPLSFDGDGVDVGPSTRDAAMNYCKERRAFYIVDPPKDWISVSVAEAGVDGLGLRDENVGIYFPRVQMIDPLRDNQLSTFAPCGVVAGIYARTDARRGVWKAPAGIDATMTGVRKLSVLLTDGENGRLNPIGVNCLRTFPVAGNIVWGARTLEGADQLASEWKYVPVRRTALYIEESLYRGLKWVVFEPNDEPLWAQIRLNAGSFMHTLFRQGAFQGSAPKDAYLVKCDKETTTQADIDRGIVNILVGFAPLKPAEFVFLRIQQLAGQIQT